MSIDKNLIETNDNLDILRAKLAFIFLADRAIVELISEEGICLSNDEISGMREIKDDLLEDIAYLGDNLHKTRIGLKDD